MLRLAPGTTLSHYRIIEELGQGGQATAWKAEDIRLQRLVVIKTLLPELAATESARRRFEREARLVSALDHPNICTIYDIGETDGLVYMVLPFIAGLTLKQFIAQAGNGQPLELVSALSLAIQIADALTSAHARGIIHRDIKPGNIIVNDYGQAKVLDFGLAKLTALDGNEGNDTGGLRQANGTERIHDRSMTEIGVPYGTMGYGSPEQATGDRVDHRTDIFSLGVLLYEMLTGQQPFSGRNRIEIFHATIYNPVRPLRELNPHAPASLQTILERALAKEPQARYATMAEFRDALKQVWQATTNGTTLLPFELAVPTEAAKTGRSSWRLTGALGRVIGNSSLGQRVFGRTKDRSRAEALTQPEPVSNAPNLHNQASVSKTPSNNPIPVRPDSWGTETKKTIAVVPFKNLSGHAADKFYEFALADGITTELTHLHSLVVRPSSYIAQYVDQQIDTRQVGEDLAVSAVLTGSFFKTAERFRVYAQLVAAQSGEILWGDKMDIDARDVLSIQDTIAERIIAGLKLNLTEEEQERIEKPLTASPEAYEYYLRGRDLLFQYTARTFNDADLDVAIKMFEQAVRLDPNFARAHSGLGRCYVHHGQGYGGEQFYELAAASLTRALELDPELTGAQLQMVYVHLHRGEKEEALSLLADVRRDNPSEPTVFIIAGMLYRLNGQYEKALRQYDRLLELSPSDIVVAAYNRARILSYQGKYEEALAELNEGRAAEPDHPLIHAFTAVVKFSQGEVTQSLAIAEATLKRHPHFDALRILMARCLSAQGQHEAAQALITEQVKQTAAADHDIAFWMASFYSMEGMNDEALEWLQRAIKLGNENYPYFAQNKKLDKLRGDARFRAVMEALRVRWEERN